MLITNNGMIFKDREIFFSHGTTVSCGNRKIKCNKIRTVNNSRTTVLEVEIDD